MDIFKDIVENLPEPVLLTSEQGKVKYTNCAFKKIFKTDIRSEDISVLLNEDNIYFAAEKKYRIIKEKYSDVTVIKLLEVNSTMEEAYTDFISTVSHELRTPLTSIRGFADTILLSFDRLDAEQIKKFLSIIKDQSNRLIKLTENLLSVSKLQTKNESLIYKSLNVSNQIESIITLVKNQYKNHKFSFECKSSLPILADENKFQQIMINLLDNAAKYSPEGSEVKISVSESTADKKVLIKIKDEGPGIKAEDIQKVFNKFTRVENHLTSKTQGSGLGLYIVKNLTEKMGGEITAESVFGNGASFILSFPEADYSSQLSKKMRNELC